MYELSHDLAGALSPVIVMLAMMMMTGGSGGSSSYAFSGCGLRVQCIAAVQSCDDRQHCSSNRLRMQHCNFP